MTSKNHFDGENYQQSFRTLNNSLPGADIDWLSNLRCKSIERFSQVGIPGPKVEEWKYTNLAALNNKTFALNTSIERDVVQIESAYQKAIFKDNKGSKVVFVNGVFCKERTDIKIQHGVTLKSFIDFVTSEPVKAKALFDGQRNDNSLNDLNLAFMTDGFLLHVDKDVKLAEPIEIIHISTGEAVDKALISRNFIHIEQSSSVKVIESFWGVDATSSWGQYITNVMIDKKADLEIYQFQNEGNEAIHMAETLVDLDEKANFTHYSLNIGGKQSRTEIKPTLKGANANVNLRGAFLGRSGNSHDVFTHMKHMVAECDSDQVYRGVLDNGGKSAFQGKVYVAKDAQLTNANQSNKNLLLDRSAEANSKPELLIYADDVKCAHGATVGELDQEAMFYLNSRGLDHVSAKALLVEAFVAEVFEEINVPGVQEKYLELARNWLETGQ